MQTLEQKIDRLIELIENKPRQDNQDIYSALSKAQSMMSVIRTNKRSKYWDKPYSDLSSVLEAVREPLTSNGLAIIQRLNTEDNGETYLHTILTHSSGQQIQCRMRFTPPDNDLSTLSSYLSAMKRFIISSLLGVSSEAEDDNADIASSKVRSREESGLGITVVEQTPLDLVSEYISEEQLHILRDELEGYDDIVKGIYKNLEISSLSDMKKSQYKTAINRIREIKLLRRKELHD
jgi:hypothetical protein